MLRDVTIAQDRLAGAGQKLAQPVTENQDCPRKRDCKNSKGFHYRKAKPERTKRDRTIANDRLVGMAQMERDVTIKIDKYHTNTPYMHDIFSRHSQV